MVTAELLYIRSIFLFYCLDINQYLLISQTGEFQRHCGVMSDNAQVSDKPSDLFQSLCISWGFLVTSQIYSSSLSEKEVQSDESLFNHQLPRTTIYSRCTQWLFPSTYSKQLLSSFRSTPIPTQLCTISERLFSVRVSRMKHAITACICVHGRLWTLLSSPLNIMLYEGWGQGVPMLSKHSTEWVTHYVHYKGLNSSRGEEEEGGRGWDLTVWWEWVRRESYQFLFNKWTQGCVGMQQWD